MTNIVNWKNLWIASLTCAVAGLALQTRDAAGGDPPPAAKNILDKAVEAHGGAQRIGRDVALIRTEEGEMLVDGEKIPLKGEWQFQPPDKRAFQLIAQIGDLKLNMSAGIDGDKGWTKCGPAPAIDLTPDQVAAHIWEHVNHMQSIQVLVDKRGDFDASTPKAFKYGADRDAWLIDFTGKKNKRVVSLAFDKTTGQFIGDESVVSFGRLGDKSREKPVKFRVVFNDYIDVDGVKMPGKLSITRDGAPFIEIRKVEMRVVDKIDPKVFEKPKTVSSN